MEENHIHDFKIGADNYMLEMSIHDYYNLVKDNLNDNEYQRKRVRNASSIYSLLKKDLIEGCVMPPIVLAYSGNVENSAQLIGILNDSKSEIKILDGLQRSYTIKEIVDDYKKGIVNVTTAGGNPLDNKIRVEIYTGLNKIGVLYRMLTLNTGQTQMTTRHQIEIIYSEYKCNCSVKGVTLLSETDGVSPANLGEYKFRDVVDGFTSYLQKDYLTLDRMDILDNVRNLERLSKSSMENNIFDDYLDSYNSIVVKLSEAFPYTCEVESLMEELELKATPYATSIMRMFNKSQSLTGYGNAIATLQDLGIVKDFCHVRTLVSGIRNETTEFGFKCLNKQLDNVRGLAKKIGNDQRLYFYHFFKKLFDFNEPSYLDVNIAAQRAFTEYQRIVS